jgi:hypothetical protein
MAGRPCLDLTYTRLRSHELQFQVSRDLVLDRKVEAAMIAETFDPVNDVESRLSPRFVHPPAERPRCRSSTAPTSPPKS